MQGSTSVQQILDTLDEAAEIILSAAGEDGIISRRDIREKLFTLKGFQQSLVDSLFRYVDRLDKTPGARVTKSDIDQVVAYVKEEIITQFDIDPSGLSFDEEERISSQGPLAVQLAQNLKRTAEARDDSSTKSLIEQLETHSKGLLFDDYGSESSEPFQTFFLEANLLRLTERDFVMAMGLDPSRPSESIAVFEPAFDYFERLIGLTQAANPEYIEHAISLVNLMQRALRSIHIIIQGLDQDGVDPVHPVFVVGLDRNNDIVGLTSFVVWT